MNNLLSHYPVILAIPVAWGDMDAFQHVNNVVYFRYFESARIAYLERLDVAGFIQTTGIGPIGSDRFVMDQCLVSAHHQQIAAQGDATTVTYDYTKGAKAPLPAAVRTRIEMLESSVGNTIQTM